MWEIDENFARAELTDAQRAEHHVRREAILVRRGEVTKRGDNQHTQASDKLSKASYSAKASADLGVDERTVRRDPARGKKIVLEVLAEVGRPKKSDNLSKYSERAARPISALTNRPPRRRARREDRPRGPSRGLRHRDSTRAAQQPALLDEIKQEGASTWCAAR